MSVARSPQNPFTAINTLSPGSTKFTKAASMAQCPVPLTASVNGFCVWKAYWIPILISVIICGQKEGRVNPALSRGQCEWIYLQDTCLWCQLMQLPQIGEESVYIAPTTSPLLLPPTCWIGKRDCLLLDCKFTFWRQKMTGKVETVHSIILDRLDEKWSNHTRFEVLLLALLYSRDILIAFPSHDWKSNRVVMWGKFIKY